LNKLFAQTVSFVVLALAHASAPAVTQTCGGTIDQTYVDWDGGLLIRPSWRGDYLRICNVRGVASGNGITIDSAVCKSWLALIMLAATSGKGITIRYADAPTCSQIPNYYSAPLPEYVMTNY
jgi:hypothetical protein